MVMQNVNEENLQRYLHTALIKSLHAAILLSVSIQGVLCY